MYDSYIKDMRDNPLIKFPYPHNFDAKSISFMTNLNELDPDYRVYSRSVIYNKLYDKEINMVIWQEGYITVAMVGHHHTLSFDFSGCCMAKYRLNGKIYTAHIHCDKVKKKDCRRLFIDYINNKHISKDFVIFRPLCNIDVFKDFHGISNIMTWGLILNNNHCYTLLCVEEEPVNNEYIYRIVCIIRHLDVERRERNRRLLYYQDEVHIRQYRGEIEYDFNELRRRWNLVFIQEHIRVLYIDKNYHRYLKWRV